MSDQAFKAVISLYEKHASAFAKMRPASLAEKAWLDRFLSSLPPGGHILDLGCGNGSPIAAYFLSQGFKVTGVDSSPSMISQCRDKFPHETWLVSDMREVNLGMNFDGILAWDSFFICVMLINVRYLHFFLHMQKRVRLLCSMPARKRVRPSVSFRVSHLLTPACPPLSTNH